MDIAPVDIDHVGDGLFELSFTRLAGWASLDVGAKAYRAPGRNLTIDVKQKLLFRRVLIMFHTSPLASPLESTQRAFQ